MVKNLDSAHPCQGPSDFTLMHFYGNGPSSLSPLSPTVHFGLYLPEFPETFELMQPLWHEAPCCHFYCAAQPRACTPRWLPPTRPHPWTVTLSSDPQASSSFHQWLPSSLLSLLLPLQNCSFFFRPQSCFLCWKRRGKEK